MKMKNMVCTYKLCKIEANFLIAELKYAYILQIEKSNFFVLLPFNFNELAEFIVVTCFIQCKVAAVARQWQLVLI